MMVPEGARAVTAEDNLFDQKSHANPLARLMEIVANSVEHGAASHVPTAPAPTSFSHCSLAKLQLL